MKNTRPGQDLILCRLSGCNLEKTGVIAGMSGSPVYIRGKLLGAVAYAWQFGKEPIAGVTPFCQMKSYAKAHEKLKQQGPVRLGLRSPVTIGNKKYNSVTVSNSFAAPQPASVDGLWLTPLRTPLMASGFSAHSLSLLGEQLKNTGLVPMQGGGVSGRIARREENTRLQPGGALSVALILGDFDLSGIGTVTHIEGNRVYGWGHPFMSLGHCEIPMMTGYVHTIYPRQNLSFKMGSPLKTVGVINSDVSTCIAGWLGKEPDMLPVRMKVTREDPSRSKIFNIQVVRQQELLSNLVFTALTNSVEIEGKLPEELTARMRARIELDGHKSIVLEDTFSGTSFSGGRAPRALYSQIANILSSLTFNEHKRIRIKRIDCETTLQEGRCTGEVESVELDSEVYRPGETLRATVFIKPHKQDLQKIRIELPLPNDLPEGKYEVRICDDRSNIKETLRSDPTLKSPQSLSSLYQALELQTSVQRTAVVLRIPLDKSGVAVNGKSLWDLPPSMIHILAHSRRTGAKSLSRALVAKQITPWVVQGSEAIGFRVSRTKRILSPK